MQFDQEGPRVGYKGSVGSRIRDVFLRVIAIVLVAALVAGAFVVSLVFFAVAFAVALVVVGYFWWRTRHLRKQMRQRVDGRDVIEGEVLKSE
jgi:predicted membrane protein